MKDTKDRLGELLRFSALLDRFRHVERVIRIKDSDRWENDVEHSYFLAMLAWHIVESDDLPLNRDLVFRYALAHDLAEAYAGDTYIYSDDKSHLKSKASREQGARERIRKEFPEFPELHEIMERYEQREDAESRFVYALDKIQPVIQIYLDGGRTWKEKRVTLRMLVENKQDKINLSPEIRPYFDELVELLGQESGRLF